VLAGAAVHERLAGVFLVGVRCCYEGDEVGGKGVVKVRRRKDRPLLFTRRRGGFNNFLMETRSGRRKHQATGGSG